MDNGHHYGWMIVVLIVFFGCYWIYSSNRPDSYTKGATHNEQIRTDWPFSLHIGEGGCATIGADRAKKVVNKDAPILNEVKK